MGTLITILAIYTVGYFLSLWGMHSFKDELDINHYDHANDGWDDDWDSNAEAYAALSLGWPFFWLAMSIKLLWRGLLSISKQLENNGSSKSTDGPNVGSQK
jgi:hypothetical protein